MYARQSSTFEEPKNELLKVQQEFAIIDPSLPTAFASLPTHYVGTAVIERKREVIAQGPEVFITEARESPIEAQVTSVATHVLYNEEFALDLLYSFNQSSDNFELETMIKFKKFEHITDIYIEEEKQFINIKVFINLERYDYNLMNNIFNDAEFPLKDKFEKDKLFNFQYIYKKAIKPDLIEYLGKRIFHRF